MVIFRAASSLDICCGAYRATGAEYGWMPADGWGFVWAARANAGG